MPSTDRLLSYLDFRRDCMTCKLDAQFTGDFEMRPDGKYWATMRCVNCGSCSMRVSEWQGQLQTLQTTMASTPQYAYALRQMLSQDAKVLAPFIASLWRERTSGPLAPMMRVKRLPLRELREEWQSTDLAAKVSFAQALKDVLLEYPQFDFAPTESERKAEVASLAAIT